MSVQAATPAPSVPATKPRGLDARTVLWHGAVIVLVLVLMGGVCPVAILGTCPPSARPG